MLANISVHRIAGLKLSYAWTHCLHSSGEIGAEEPGRAPEADENAETDEVVEQILGELESLSPEEARRLLAADDLERARKLGAVK